MIKPKILFATPILHHPPIGGPTLRIENSIKALSQISDLYIYSRARPSEIGGVDAVTFYKKYSKEFYFSPFVSPQSSLLSRITFLASRVINKISRKTIGKNILNRHVESKRDYKNLLDIASKVQADIIWLGFGNISYPLLKYIKENSNSKVVLDTDSVWSRFILRGLPYAKTDKQCQHIDRLGQEKIKEEKWGTKLADVTTAVSEIDAEYYRDLAKDPRQVHLFSNVIDLDSYQVIPQKPPDFHQPAIYLAGTFGPDSPMDDAARWVINQVLPLVRNQIPNIHFYIIGNGSDKTLLDIHDPQITITGKLNSVLPYLCHVNLALVPLRFESGTRFKILEAGACKIPVVSTTLGAEGIPITDEHDILIADQPEDFARAIIRLIENPSLSEDIANNLYALIQKNYSISTLIDQGIKIIDYLA
ncbi:glycosyltransferase family 4 protein [Cylindrospermopsis raciborskii G7]|uniref:glycosyltransferase family 4 protein n=1 Tax=Cylindrospermopsis raciborskii TaxID=77022 RepID=UPI003EC0385E